MRSDPVRIPSEDIELAGVLHRPTRGTAAAVLMLHGWGPPDMDGADCLRGSAEALVERDYAALALSMRGWPHTGGVDDCGARQPGDAKLAVDWLTGQEGVDASRLAILGFSQGGQVALLAAALGAPVRAVVAYYPVTDVEQWGQTSDHEGIREWYVPEVCMAGIGPRARSPVYFADRIDVPVLLVHGDRDTRVPTEQSLWMEEALRSEGKSVELHLVPAVGHGKDAWPPDVWKREFERVIGFLDRALGVERVSGRG